MSTAPSKGAFFPASGAVRSPWHRRDFHGDRYSRVGESRQRDPRRGGPRLCEACGADPEVSIQVLCGPPGLVVRVDLYHLVHGEAEFAQEGPDLAHDGMGLGHQPVAIEDGPVRVHGDLSAYVDHLAALQG